MTALVKSDVHVKRSLQCTTIPCLFAGTHLIISIPHDLHSSCSSDVLFNPPGVQFPQGLAKGTVLRSSQKLFTAHCSTDMATASSPPALSYFVSFCVISGHLLLEHLQSTCHFIHSSFFIISTMEYSVSQVSC